MAQVAGQRVLRHFVRTDGNLDTALRPKTGSWRAMAGFGADFSQPHGSRPLPGNGPAFPASKAPCRKLEPPIPCHAALSQDIGGKP